MSEVTIRPAREDELALAAIEDLESRAHRSDSVSQSLLTDSWINQYTNYLLFGAVIVGGPVFALHPERAVELGADGTAHDAREAPALAARLVAAKAVRP